MAATPDNEPTPAETPSGGWRMRLRGLLVGALRPVLAAPGWLITLARKNLMWSLAAVFFLVSGIAMAWLMRSWPGAIRADGLTVQAAMERLDDGQYSEARRLAAALQESGRLPSTAQGGPHFVQGAALAYDADGALDAAARSEQFLLAAKHLQLARRHGFPAGREREGLLLLAESLQQSGEYARSLPVLTELKTDSGALEGEASRLLTIAYLRLSPPQLDKAQTHCDAFLADAGALDEQHHHRGWLLRAEIGLLRGDNVASRSALENIPETSPLRPEALVMQGRVLLAEAEQIESTADDPAADKNDRYRRAIDSFKRAITLAPHDIRATPQAAFFVGRALRQSGNLAAARDQFTATAKRHYDAPEGTLAGLEAAEVMLDLGEPEAAQQSLMQTIHRVGPPVGYVNCWLSLDDLRERVEAINARLLAAHQYELAVQLSFSLPPLFSEDRALELRATAHEQWAQHWAHQAEGTLEKDRSDRLVKARRHYRQAGVDFARLAHLHYTQRRYPGDLWRSGRNFALGRDFQSAITLLRAYLDTEADNQRPLVMVTLGEALLSRGEASAATEVLEDCLRDYAKDPASYKARLTASQAYLEQGELDRAEQLLRDNLHHEELTPRSDMWRDSLFALGSLLYVDGRSRMIEYEMQRGPDDLPSRSVTGLEIGHQRLQDAVRQLSEAVARYPDHTETVKAHYQIAASHRHAAQLPLEKLKTEAIENRQLALNRQVRRHLTDALESYDRLLAHVAERESDGAPSAVNASIVRNAYFARGAVLYDMGRYEDAIAAYSAATSRYQNEPASIEAYVQIAACHRRLNRPLAARGTLEQAKLVIERIDPDIEFSTTSRFSRDEWIEHLSWMATL